MKTAILALLLAVPGRCSDVYQLKDTGDFAPTGHRVEFADRYGWTSYEADFQFSLEGGRALTRDSKLKITIVKRDGSKWRYTCKASADTMTGSVNVVYGNAVSVLAECRIPERAFAKAVDMEPEDVGRPTLVFQALVQDGQVRAGAQRGVYFLPAGQIESTDLNAYASNAEGLAVVFRSN